MKYKAHYKHIVPVDQDLLVLQYLKTIPYTCTCRMNGSKNGLGESDRDSVTLGSIQCQAFSD